MPQADAASRRILVVDDEQEIIDVLKEYLAKGGHIVDSAQDGTRAIELVRARRPDLVFLDIHMPGINGVDALKAIKEFDSRLPVIVITANDDNALAATAIAGGAFSHVQKPFDLRYLDHLLAAALSRGGGRTG
jgi:CheY-like chemotaxis protein